MKTFAGRWCVVFCQTSLLLCCTWAITGQDKVGPKGSVPEKTIKPQIGKKPGDALAVTALKMKMCWCPPGTFSMGSPESEKGRTGVEGPVEVTLTSGFWIGKYEVTQSEWEKVMNTDVRGQMKLPNDGRITGVGPNFAMYLVNQAEAAEFCQKLTEQQEKANRLPEGWVYRLPTEAEWEYSCRAGTKTATTFGAELTKKQANFGQEGGLDGALAVGSYKPNAWQIHDTHGNVKEWCADTFEDKLPGGANPYTNKSTGANDGTARGGGFNNSAGDCRSATRYNVTPTERKDDIGFRVVFGPALPTK